jgi:hypothetical protein
LEEEFEIHFLGLIKKKIRLIIEIAADKEPKTGELG